MHTAAILCTETAIGWVALCEELPGLCGLGDDEESAMLDLGESIRRYIDGQTLH